MTINPSAQSRLEALSLIKILPDGQDWGVEHRDHPAIVAAAHQVELRKQAQADLRRAMQAIGMLSAALLVAVMAIGWLA